MLSGLARAFGHEVALLAGALEDREVLRRHPEGLRAPFRPLQPAEDREAAGARALEDAHPAGVQRLVEALGEAARQLGRIGGRRHHRDGVQEEPHVAIVLRLVAREDPLQPVQAARALDVRPLLPHAHAAGVVPLGRAQRLVATADQLLAVDGLLAVRDGQAGAEVQAQDPAVVAVLAEPSHDVLRDHPAHVGPGVEEDHGEDRAPVARHVVVAAQAGAEARGDLPQDEVSGTPVQPLVHPAEVVGPEEDEHGGGVGLLGLGQRRLELGLELRTLRQAGHLVEERPRDRPCVGGEGRGQAEEVLPPALVAERVAGGREIDEPVLPPGDGVAIEPQARPGRDLAAEAAVALAPLRPRRVLVRLGQHPAQRDPVEDPVRALAGETNGALVAAFLLAAAEPAVELRRRRRVGQLRNGLQAPVVEEDLLLAAGSRGHVERDGGGAAEASHEPDVGAQDVGGFAHTASGGSLRHRGREVAGGWCVRPPARSS